MAGAVSAAAEEVYAAFDQEAREAARQVLVRLADQDDQGAIRRRQVPMDEIDPAGDPASRHGMVVETLVRRRLLTLDRDHVEVAHEALLVAWPRLARWLEEDSVGRVVRSRLSPDAVDWDREGRPTEQLYRGARLQAAADWADDPRSGATALEREFVAAGGALAEQELWDARDRATTEAAARRRTRRLAAGLAVFLVVALVATGVAVVFQRSADRRAAEAETAGTVADANRLAAQASGARSLDLSLLLAANALRTAVTPATEDGLLNALLVHRRATEVHAVPTGEADISLSVGRANRLRSDRRLRRPRGDLADRTIVGAPGAGELVARLHQRRTRRAIGRRCRLLRGRLGPVGPGYRSLPRRLRPRRWGAAGVVGARRTRGHPGGGPLHARGEAAHRDERRGQGRPHGRHPP